MIPFTDPGSQLSKREEKLNCLYFLFKCLLHVPGEGGDEEGEEKAAGAAPEDQAEPGQHG